MLVDTKDYACMKPLSVQSLEYFVAENRASNVTLCIFIAESKKEGNDLDVLVITNKDVIVIVLMYCLVKMGKIVICSQDTSFYLKRIVILQFLILRKKR